MKAVTFGKYNSLNWNIPATDYLYKVAITVPDKILTYQISVKYEVDESGKYFLSLKAAKYLVNREVPDLLADQLAHKCGKILYPLQLSVSKEGEINTIHNYPQIRQGWNKQKDQLFLYYKDSYSLNYLQHTDLVFNSEKLLVSQLKNSPFFYLYFGGIYNKTCGEEFYREYTEKYKGADYTFSQWVDTHTDEQNCFSLYREGINEDRKEKLYQRYFLEDKDKNIDKAVFIYMKNEQIVQQVNITRLPDNKPNQTSKEEKENTQRKFSFWIDEKRSNLN